MGISSKVVSDLMERLATLRGTAHALEEQRRAALRGMRESMKELRRLGDTLVRQRHDGPGGADRQSHSHALALAEQYGLTRRELEVCLLLAEGRSNREIAQLVKVSTHTARHHTQHVLAKLGVRSRSRAAALVNDFLSPNGAR
jgi:DNA-binding CsgD family transcriptional regulator